MDNYRAVAIAEGFEEPTSHDEVIQAWQHLQDTGLGYQLQGWFGRQLKQLIDAGVIAE